MEKSKSMTVKKVFNSTDIFTNGRIIPPFLKGHPHFTTNPLKIEKVFPSLGLANFKQEANIVKCMTDFKKEAGYVWNLLQDISNECLKAKELISTSSSKMQFLAPLGERLAAKAKLNDVAQIINCLNFLSDSCDPRSVSAFHPTNGVVVSNGGKVELRLHAPIIGNDGKIIHKAGIPIFRLYKQLRDKCIEHGVAADDLLQLEAIESYKVFGRENIPNKKYHIIFSSDGEEGAWDILTMSMRGAKSCQRWDGEYPRCLIGSILSKFIGVIYLTSGSNADQYGEFGSLGSKMMRRCVVRYAFDKNENTPCLVMDKMYPSEDEEIIKSFIESLNVKLETFNEMRNIKDPQRKGKPIPIYYGPRLGNKTRHIYIPNEKITNKITNRERSYQDTALRTKCELDVHILAHNYLEIERSTQRIQNKFGEFLTYKLEEIAHSHSSNNPELRKIIKNLGLTTSYGIIADTLTSNIFYAFVPPKTSEYFTARSYTKDYLKELLIKRKSIVSYNKARIDSVVKANSSCEYNLDVFCNYLSDIVAQFVKREVLSSIYGK